MTEVDVRFTPLVYRDFPTRIGGDPGGSILVERRTRAFLPAANTEVPCVLFGTLDDIEWIVWTWRVQTTGEALLFEVGYHNDSREAWSDFHSRRR